VPVNARESEPVSPPRPSPPPPSAPPPWSSEPAPVPRAQLPIPGSASLGPATTELASWNQAIERVRREQPRHGKSLSFGRLIAVGPTAVRLAFAADAGFHRATVFDSGRAVIEKLLSQHYGRSLHLEEESDRAAHAAAPRSIAEQEVEAREVRESAIDHKVRTHPAVASVLRILGGRLEHVQVLEAAPVPAGGDEPPPAADEEA